MAVAKAQVDLIARDRVSGVAANVERVLLRMQAKMQAVAQAAQRMLMVGAAAVGGMVYASIKQSEAEQTLESVLKATGNAAGFTSAQLKQMASDLQLVTAFGDETTLAAMAMLATFKDIKGDMFRDTMEAAMDLSVVMKTGLKESILMLGKALNDPAERMTALTRAGVSFTQQQIEQTKALQASGDLLGAQTLLMTALRTQFGGAARGEIEQAGGALKQMKNEVGDLAEVMGDLLMPTVMEFLVGVKRVVVGLASWVKANSEIVLKIGKWAIGLGVLLVILPRLIGLLLGMTTVLKGIAMGLIFVHSLGGPAAWVTMAVGIAAAAIAVGFLKKTYDDLADALDKAKEKGEAQAEAEKERAEERLSSKPGGPLATTKAEAEESIRMLRTTARMKMEAYATERAELKQLYDLQVKGRVAAGVAREPEQWDTAESAAIHYNNLIMSLDDQRYATLKELREEEKRLLQEAEDAEIAYAEAAATALKEAAEASEKKAVDHEKWLRKLEDEFELIGKTADEVERMKRAWAGASEQELHEGEIIQEAIERKKKELETEERKQKDLNEEAEAILAGKGKQEQVIASRFEGLTQAWKRIQASAMSGKEATVQEQQLKAVEEAAARLKEGDKKAHKKLDEVKDAIEDAMGGPAVFGP